MASRKDDGKDSGGPEKVRLSMWLTRRQHAELKMLAEYDGRTVSDIIRQLVSIHLNDPDNEKKVQERSDVE